MRVVIVDDQASARTMLAGLVSSISPQVGVQEYWATEDALESCLADPPAVLILDYRMPGLDGVSFAQRLKQAPGTSQTAIVMVSSQDDTSVRQSAFDAGVLVYLRKPLVPHEVRLQLRNLLQFQVAAAQPTVTAVEPATATVTSAALDALCELNSKCATSRPWLQYDIVSPHVVASAMTDVMTLDPRTRELVARGGQLYGLGMTGVPMDVLLSPGPLNVGARNAVDQAPRHASGIVRHVDPELADVLLHSHEHYNGSGFPSGLVGQHIPLASRILAVAGAFAGMTSVRPHRSAFSPSEAVARIQGLATVRFDPRCVTALIDAMPGVLPALPHPPRSFAEVPAGLR